MTPHSSSSVGIKQDSACADRTVDKASCQEKVISIVNSEDKQQITVVLAAILTGEYPPPQVIYTGKTLHSHPKVSFPQ